VGKGLPTPIPIPSYSENVPTITGTKMKFFVSFLKSLKGFWWNKNLKIVFLFSPCRLSSSL